MLNLILASLAGLSFVLTFWRWLAAMRFPLHQRSRVATSLPGLAILKPLKGFNDETRHCLRSWFCQTYPGPVQILFGVAAAGDPVCAVVKELIAEFPQTDAQLIICDQALGANGKVSTLRQLEPHIRNPIVMISDADVEAPGDFALSVAPKFADPKVGLVNCFYRLANPTTLAMRWEAIAINADFWSQVLQSNTIRAPDFALGAVMTLPAEDLKKIGGFAPLSDFLADDYQLGRLVAQAGGRIEFSTVVVDCYEAPMTFQQVWTHQLRWARTIRVCQPAPYFFSILGNATFWPLLWLFFGRGFISLSLVCLVFRWITSGLLERRIRVVQNNWLLSPIKDLLEVMVWAAAFVGNHVDWRGQRYRILRGGKLLKV